MVLEMKDINKSFGAKEVLKGVSFRAEGGSAFGLLGRNGAGKTTSIRILMDVFPADSGQVLLDGKPVDYSKIGLGYLPEERGLYPKKPIGEQLVYLARLKGMGKKAAEQAELDAIRSLPDEEAMSRAIRRVSEDTDRITRRNMKECVSEYIQALSLSDTDFARFTLYSKKTMRNCFRYIIRKAR